MPHPVLAKIAADTLAAVERGSCTDSDGNTHTIVDLSKTPAATDYYAPDSTLSSWATSSSPSEPSANAPATQFVLLKSSTLEGVQHCVPLAHGRKIGVLNFACATRPGGGFISGARAQEESIARSSNLYSSLMTPTAQPGEDKYYTHAMIYTRGVQLFRSDDGEWVAPTAVDALTSAAVNAGVVRSPPTKDVEKAIEDNEGTQDLVLGSFGTGVFRNKVPVVAKLWVELLVAPEARFKKSFRRVAFAIIDEKTCGCLGRCLLSLGWILRRSTRDIPIIGHLDLDLHRRARSYQTLYVAIRCEL
ncbi:hypothetical protein K438DRAFT_1910620 [Mycena galopus ATCC 62051]|nr:hypothetical protein K438DRAFT_1910620 [Mycena galopus ATCC 62051]